MNKISETGLSRRLEKAAQQVKVGASYVHYKGGKYKVMGLAILEATDKPYVVYQALYGDQLTFLRPVSEWLEVVERDNQRFERFRLIDLPD